MVIDFQDAVPSLMQTRRFFGWSFSPQMQCLSVLEKRSNSGDGKKGDSESSEERRREKRSSDAMLRQSGRKSKRRSLSAFFKPFKAFQSLSLL